IRSRGIGDLYPTQYCGPGTSREHPALLLLQPGECMEGPCKRHDDCYGDLQQNQCVDIGKCNFSQLTHTCDSDLYTSYTDCLLTFNCNAHCQIIGGIMAGVALVQEINTDCDYGGAYDCAVCVGGCCQDPGYQDCSYTGCGNGICDPYETCASCIRDCAVQRNCPANCSDGYCDFLDGESCLTCPQDCPDTFICGNAQTTCAPVSTATCYSGPPTTEGIGLCRAGTKTCNLIGTAYGPCVGEVTPETEVCGNGADEDCNGTDATCPTTCPDGNCTSGETCSSCPQDCGTCGAVCGNASCDGTETRCSCPQDCGAE